MHTHHVHAVFLAQEDDGTLGGEVVALVSRAQVLRFDVAKRLPVGGMTCSEHVA